MICDNNNDQKIYFYCYQVSTNKTLSKIISLQTISCSQHRILQFCPRDLSICVPILLRFQAQISFYELSSDLQGTPDEQFFHLPSVSFDYTDYCYLSLTCYTDDLLLLRMKWQDFSS